VSFPVFFALPAFFGNYGAIVLPLALYIWWPLAAFVVVALVCSKSTFSVLAAYCAAVFFYWYRNRRVFWFLVVLGGACLVAFIAVDLPTGQFNRRLTAWQVIADKGFKKQFIGHGLGTYNHPYIFMEGSPSLEVKFGKSRVDMLAFAYLEAKAAGNQDLMAHTKELAAGGKFNPESLAREFQKHGMDLMVWGQAHNEFLQVFFEMGLIGVLIIGLFIFDMFRRFSMYGKNIISLTLMSSFIAILVVSFAHFPFHIARLAGTCIVLMAFLDVSLLQSREKLESTI